MSSALGRAGQLEGGWEKGLGAEGVAVAECTGKLFVHPEKIDLKGSSLTV